MGTRSVIARQEGDTWRGRYVHWDGYPSAKVPELLALVSTSGYEAAVKFLTEDHHSWSTLAETAADCSAHTNGDPDAWVEADGDDWGAEWAYVLNHSGFTVLQRVHVDGRPASGYWGLNAAENGAWLIVGRIGYAAEPDEETITRLECGEKYERCKHYAWKHFPEAEGTRYGTAQWLGRAEPRFDQAVQVERAGIRYNLTGSGGTGTAQESSWQEFLRNPTPSRVRYWWASVRPVPVGLAPTEAPPDTATTDLRIARVIKAGYKLEHALVFPPTAVRGELIVQAGETIR